MDKVSKCMMKKWKQIDLSSRFENARRKKLDKIVHILLSHFLCTFLSLCIWQSLVFYKRRHTPDHSPFIRWYLKYFTRTYRTISIISNYVYANAIPRHCIFYVYVFVCTISDNLFCWRLQIEFQVQCDLKIANKEIEMSIFWSEVFCTHAHIALKFAGTTVFLLLHFLSGVFILLVAAIAFVAIEYKEMRVMISFVLTQLIELRVQIILRLCKHRFVIPFPLMTIFFSC